MATTPVVFDAYENQTSLNAFLVALTGASGTPNPSGYSATEVRPGLYQISIPEALVGEFEIYVLTTTDEVAYRGYVTLVDTTTSTRTYDYTNVGDLSQITAIKAKTDLIGTEQGLVPVRMSAGVISLFIGEQHTYSLATSDYTSRTIVLLFEDVSGTVTTVLDADLAKTSDSIAFDIPEAVTLGTGKLDWSLRDASTDEVLQYGTVNVIKTSL